MSSTPASGEGSRSTPPHDRCRPILSVHLWAREDAKRDLRDLGLGSYADAHCYHLGKFPYGGDLGKSHPEGVMFATYQTLISKNREQQTRLDQLIEWCGGEDFDGLIM